MLKPTLLLIFVSSILISQAQIPANSVQPQKITDTAYLANDTVYFIDRMKINSDSLKAKKILPQTPSVFGKIIDSKDNSSLTGVNILLTNLDDTTKIKGTSTDADGNFSLSDISNGNYLLNISYISYKDVNRKINVNDKSVDVKTISMTEDSKLLKEVIVEGKQIRVQQKGDTAQFNADAFKVNKDATTEDLLTKMPGVTSESGTIKVNGEEVKKVLVDGKEFFGDDTRTAVQNLPADIIDKIQVFDRLSDQSAFTGFDDGNSQKTINIITKNGLSNSKLGKFYAGYGGPGNRYNLGFNFNSFKGDRRISILGMGNNINQQNFNIQDLLGATGGTSNRGGRVGRNSPANNFLVGQQNGISNTSALGLNYSDKIGKNKKVAISGSYFFNATLNDNISSSVRNYISENDSGLVYNESKKSSSKNFNNRLNFKIEYAIDSSNSITFTPSLTTQNYFSNSTLNASNIQNSIATLSTDNSISSKSRGISFSNDILFMHKFAKKGRTISVNFTSSINTKIANGSLLTYNNSATDSIFTGDTINQKSKLNNTGYTFSGNIVYTEPIRKFGQLSVSYVPSYTKSISDKTTNNFDSPSDSYTLLDTALSNNFNNKYITNKLGISYRYNNKKLSWSVGLNGQDALLRSQQLTPDIISVNKNFLSLLPNADLNYKFSKTENIRFFYRTSTSAPSISQLQNVIDNSNSLILSSGNPELKQTFSQNIGIRYGRTNVEKATNLFVFANASNTINYIANSTSIFSRDTLINGINAVSGTQFSQPVNLNGYWNVRSFITYGFPLSKLKSNMNVNGGFQYSRTPTLINDVRNTANSYAVNAGITLSSNISKKIDFTISYSANYNIVRNTLQQQNNSNYFNHTASAKVNYQFWKGFVFNTSVINSLNAGGTSSYNTSYWLLNASLAYKFLKDESLELKFSANDILNQNRSITRNVTDIYTEDVTSNVLQRYFMGTITYTLKKLGTNSKTNNEQPKDFMMGPPPGNGPPPRDGNMPPPSRPD